MNNDGERTVYVANVPIDMTDEHLMELFAKFGPIQSARLKYNRETGHARGFGFVEFRNAASATDAIRMMNGDVVNGRRLIVSATARTIETLPPATAAVYVVNVTQFDDDHKKGGIEQSTMSGPYMFKTKRAAESWLCEWLAKLIDAQAGWDKRMEEHEQYFDRVINGYTWRVKNAHRQDTVVLRMLEAIWNKGSYVPRLWACTLNEFDYNKVL
jgi:RNA recognition motif-containing protein